MKKLLLFTAVLGLTQLSFATKWRVNNSGVTSAKCHSLKQALDSCSAGDTLYFEPTGIPYSSKLDTLTKAVVMIGPGYFLGSNGLGSSAAELHSIFIGLKAAGTVMTGMTVANGMTIKADNVMIESCYLSNGGIYIADSVNNCFVKKCYINYRNDGKSSQRNIWGGSYCNNIMILNNFCMNNGGYYQCGGIYVNNANIAYNFIDVAQNSQWDINSINGTNSIIKFNLYTKDCGSSVGGQIVGSYALIESNFAWDSKYFKGGTSPDASYMLLSTATAVKGKGENGTDPGPFGGSDPYVLSGLPALPRIINAQISTSGSATGGLPVKFKAVGK